MKLLCCARCSEVFSLSLDKEKECSGGHGGGKYISHLDVRIWGSRSVIFLLGFANSSFSAALAAQRYHGDSLELMNYSGGSTPKGRDFTAFVIPYAARSVVWFETKEDAYGIPMESKGKD